MHHETSSVPSFIKYRKEVTVHTYYSYLGKQNLFNFEIFYSTPQNVFNF